MPKRSTELYANFIQRVRAPQEDIDFFSAVPIARPYITSGAYRPIPFITRTKSHAFSEGFFETGMNTADRIPRVLAFTRKGDFERLYSSLSPSASPSSSSPDGGRGGETGRSAEANGPENPGFIVFAQLGRGVNGWRDTLHGGVLAVLLDEVFAPCAEGYRAVVSGDQARIYTAKLEVMFRAPVVTPCVVMIKTWVSRKKGRKYFLEAEIVTEDGVVKARARSLLIETREYAL